MRERGSETFGTEEMNTEEVILFAQSAKSNGSETEVIFKDIQMIDKMLAGTKLIRVLSPAMSFTKTGRMRKNVNLSSFYDQIIEERIKEDQQEKP